MIPPTPQADSDDEVRGGRLSPVLRRLGLTHRAAALKKMGITDIATACEA
eukprot:gene16365-55500_t